MAGKIDYMAFSNLFSEEDLERIRSEKIAKAEQDIPDLRLEWLELLKERPYSVAELVGSIPENLEHVLEYALPASPVEAVAKIFEGFKVIVRYKKDKMYANDKDTIYYGLGSGIEPALAKIKA